MKKSILLIALVTFVITGCVSTQMSEDIAYHNKNKVVTKISEAERIQLTYRFRNSLIAEEQKEFYDYLGTESAIKQLSPKLNNALGDAGAFGKASFVYTTEWEKALLNGNINELIGTTLLAGAVFSAITPSKERHKRQFQYYLKSTDETDITKRQRKKTINTIYSFGEKYGYQVICDIGCKGSLADLEGYNSFILTLKDTVTNQSSFHKPNFIYVTLDLKPLQKANNIDGPLLGQDYNYQSGGAYDWRVSAVTPHNNRPPKFITFPDGRKTITSGSFSGSKLHRKFYELLTSEIKGLSYFTNDFHNHLAFYDGKTYQLHEELTDNSIVKGVLE